MKMTRLIVLLGFVLGFAISLTTIRAQQGGAAVAIDNDDIGGVVTGARGPEAGVWVIAETRDLPTRLIKIVVTNDQGRYLLPDLPKATYDVWVRGYGLVDSAKMKATPGKTVNLTAAPARRAGRERNVVITMWDFGSPKTSLHDEIASDKRNPTVTANGPIYGATEESTQFLPVVNPADNSATQVALVVRDPKTPSAA